MADDIGVWEPRPKQDVTLAQLERFVAVMTDDLPDLAALLPPDVVTGEAWLMQQDADAWQVAEQLDVPELEALVRFFTLAEAQLPGWEAGAKSPVIYLVKMLKRRDAFEPALRKWIKSHTDNRYLPYGSAL